MNESRIYLDNAATSWPKPESVYDAVNDYQRENGSPLGRGNYAAAAEVARTVEMLRSDLAKLIGVSDPKRIVFTYSGTDSLNMAIHGVLRPGDHVVTTCAEHNSVLRPLRFLEDISGGTISVTRVPLDNNGVYQADDVIRAIRPETQLVVAIHASNVTGAIYPVQAIGEFCANDGPLFLVDAAQTVGHFPIDVERLNCDFLAAPGHKGLMGPTGTGVLYMGPRTDGVVQPYRQGGTGTQSESDEQPPSLPDRFESGNHNVPGLIGLAAGVRFVLAETVASLAEHERSLISHLQMRLDQLGHITTYGPRDELPRLGVLSLNADGMDPQELSVVLDASIEVQCRSGYHCAPLMHRALGTDEKGGTVRISVGKFNTLSQIDAVADLLSEMA